MVLSVRIFNRAARGMSARRRGTRWRASRRRTPSRSARSSSSTGRPAKSSSSRPRSERNASSLPLCGVAVTSTTWRAGSAVTRRRRSWRCCRPRPAPPARVQPCASSTITHSGHRSAKSSARRGALMKSVDTTVNGCRSKTDTPSGRSRSRRWMVLESTSAASMWNFSSSSRCHCSARCGGHSTAMRRISPRSSSSRAMRHASMVLPIRRRRRRACAPGRA